MKTIHNPTHQPSIIQQLTPHGTIHEFISLEGLSTKELEERFATELLAELNRRIHIIPVHGAPDAKHAFNVSITA